MQDYWWNMVEKKEDPNPELQGTPWDYVKYDPDALWLSSTYGHGIHIGYNQIDRVIKLLQGAKSKRNKSLREKISEYQGMLAGDLK